MRPAQRHLFRLGLRVGTILGASSFIIFYLRKGSTSIGFPGVLLVAFIALGAAATAFESDRQVDWYRRALFLPWSALSASLLLLLALPGVPLFYAVGLLGMIVVVPGAPVVWLVGALWIWRSDRRFRRSLAR
jgi:hypothetical protein